MYQLGHRNLTPAKDNLSSADRYEIGWVARCSGIDMPEDDTIAATGWRAADRRIRKGEHPKQLLRQGKPHSGGGQMVKPGRMEPV